MYLFVGLVTTLASRYVNLYCLWNQYLKTVINYTWDYACRQVQLLREHNKTTTYFGKSKKNSYILFLDLFIEYRINKSKNTIYSLLALSSVCHSNSFSK